MYTYIVEYFFSKINVKFYAYRKDYRLCLYKKKHLNQTYLSRKKIKMGEKKSAYEYCTNIDKKNKQYFLMSYKIFV